MSNPKTGYEIETEVIANLSGLNIETLSHYGGEFASDSLGELATLKFPAVLVESPGFSNEPTNRGNERERRLQIYVAAKDKPTVETLVETIRPKVDRVRIAAAGMPLLRDEDTIHFSKQSALCIVRMDFTMAIRVNLVGEVELE